MLFIYKALFKILLIMGFGIWNLELALSGTVIR
jgi:hypothetical protein